MEFYEIEVVDPLAAQRVADSLVSLFGVQIIEVKPGPNENMVVSVQLRGRGTAFKVWLIETEGMAEEVRILLDAVIGDKVDHFKVVNE